MTQWHIDVQIEYDEVGEIIPHIEQLLQEAAAAALDHQEVAGPATLSLLLTDDEQLQELNLQYRGYDEPTDVLSFPDGTELPEEGLYLGDIAISVPYAQRQADKQGHPLLAELRLLTVHGVLHLLGHDHAEPEEEAEMWAAQNEILAGLKGSE